MESSPDEHYSVSLMREYISSPSTLTFSPYLASLLIAISVVFGGVVGGGGGGGGGLFFSWKFAIF